MLNIYIYPVSVTGVKRVRIIREQRLNIPETGYFKLFGFLFNDFPVKEKKLFCNELMV